MPYLPFSHRPAFDASAFAERRLVFLMQGEMPKNYAANQENPDLRDQAAAVRERLASIVRVYKEKHNIDNAEYARMSDALKQKYQALDLSIKNVAEGMSKKVEASIQDYEDAIRRVEAQIAELETKYGPANGVSLADENRAKWAEKHLAAGEMRAEQFIFKGYKAFALYVPDNWYVLAPYQSTTDVSESRRMYVFLEKDLPSNGVIRMTIPEKGKGVVNARFGKREDQTDASRSDLILNISGNVVPVAPKAAPAAPFVPRTPGSNYGTDAKKIFRGMKPRTPNVAPAKGASSVVPPASVQSAPAIVSKSPDAKDPSANTVSPSMEKELPPSSSPIPSSPIGTPKYSESDTSIAKSNTAPASGAGMSDVRPPMDTDRLPAQPIEVARIDAASENPTPAPAGNKLEKKISPAIVEKVFASIPMPEWAPQDSAEAFKKPGVWIEGDNLSSYIVDKDKLYKHDYKGNCEVYENGTPTQLAGKYFDTETQSVKDIPQEALFDIGEQKWVTFDRSNPADVQREQEMIVKLGIPMEVGLNKLDSFIGFAESSVRNAEYVIGQQNWFQNFNNWLTDFDPYKQQLQNAQLRLGQLRTVKSTYDAKMETADSFRDTVDAANYLFRNMAMPEITDSLFMIAPEAGTGGVTSIDSRIVDAMKQNESNMEVTRDAIIDTSLTVGTLGAGLLANVGRKGATIAGRQVVGALTRRVAIRQGLTSGAIMAGSSSLTKNVDNVSNGKKTLGEGILDTTTDTAIGGTIGAGIGALTPTLANSLRKIFGKMDDAAKDAAEKAAKAARDAEAAAAREAEAAAKTAREAAAKAARDAEAAAAREAQKQAQEAAAKAAREAEAAAAKKAAEGAGKAAKETIGPVDDLLREYSKIKSSDRIGGVMVGKKIFGLADNFTEDALNAAYLKLAKKYQPRTIEDGKGVRGELMKQVNAARDLLKEYLKRNTRKAS